jgi:hypothetical protein
MDKTDMMWLAVLSMPFFEASFGLLCISAAKYEVLHSYVLFTNMSVDLCRRLIAYHDFADSRYTRDFSHSLSR